MLTWRFKSVLTVKSEKEMDEELEYELDDEDLDWLTNKLPEQKVQMKEDKFEQIIVENFQNFANLVNIRTKLQKLC